MGCAITARLIAKHKGLSEPEEVSVAALLHDIGKVVLSMKFPEDYEKVLAEAEGRAIPVLEAEKSHFTITHADAGGWIARKWNFPNNLVEVIEYHHKPHLSKRVTVQTAIVHLSDILVRAKGFGFAGDGLVPAVNPSAWQLLELPEEELREILKELEDSLGQAEDFLLSSE